MSTLYGGFPPSHYAMMNAFIDFTTNYHLDLDAKLIDTYKPFKNAKNLVIIFILNKIYNIHN
jgi:hypothetical protein